MNIVQVISIGLSCFSLGMAIANLIWFLAVTREKRKMLRAQRKKYREDKRAIILRITDDILLGEWDDWFSKEKCQKLKSRRQAHRLAKKVFKSGLWWLGGSIKSYGEFVTQYVPPEDNENKSTYNRL